MTALETATRTIRAFAPGALIVALGLDASEADPLAGLKITTAGFRRIGEAIARIGLHSVLVQEGGYLSDLLGVNLASLLTGFEASRADSYTLWMRRPDPQASLLADLHSFVEWHSS